MIRFCPHCHQGHLEPEPCCPLCRWNIALRAISATEGAAVLDTPWERGYGVPYGHVYVELATLPEQLTRGELFRLLTGPDGPALIGRQPWGASHGERFTRDTDRLGIGRIVRVVDDYGDLTHVEEPPHAEDDTRLQCDPRDRTDLVPVFVFDTEASWMTDADKLDDEDLADALWPHDPLHPSQRQQAA